MSATTFLRQEASALLTRLDRVRPLVVHETMVAAAAPSPAAMSAVERYLADGRSALRDRVLSFVDWLDTHGDAVPPSERQRRFTLIRLAFNDVVSQFDLFTEAVTQRSEHTTGVWLSGLDLLAADALRLPGHDLGAPAVICYLARGPGAAIRRARTRMPGGGSNPVALIRVPRERMIGHGIASSLVHETGHQGAALLGLVESLRAVLGGCWRQWISEIVADLWSVAKLGVCATLGLIGVVSLPRWFVFRPSGPDPHPVPWLRVRVSCALGDALYPDPRWRALDRMWTELYPLDQAPVPRSLGALAAEIPAFTSALLDHRPPALDGESLAEALRMPDRSPAELLAEHTALRRDPGRIAELPPTLAFAVIGQARAAELITPELESRVLGDLLTAWAVRGSLDTSVLCARASVPISVGT